MQLSDKLRVINAVDLLYRLLQHLSGSIGFRRISADVLSRTTVFRDKFTDKICIAYRPRNTRNSGNLKRWVPTVGIENAFRNVGAANRASKLRTLVWASRSYDSHRIKMLLLEGMDLGDYIVQHRSKHYKLRVRVDDLLGDRGVVGRLC